MIVKTSVPIIYKCNCPPINSNFKLTTALPVIKNGVVIGNKTAANTLNYSSVNAKDKKYVPKETTLVKKKKKDKTSFGSKVKKFVGNLKDSGAVDFAKKLIDKKLAGDEQNLPPIDTPPPVEETKKGIRLDMEDEKTCNKRAIEGDFKPATPAEN